MKGSYVSLTCIHCTDHRLWVSGSLPSKVNRSLGLVKNLSVGLTLRLSTTIYPTSSNLSRRDVGCCGNGIGFLWKLSRIVYYARQGCTSLSPRTAYPKFVCVVSLDREIHAGECLRGIVVNVERVAARWCQARTALETERDTND